MVENSVQRKLRHVVLNLYIKLLKCSRTTAQTWDSFLSNWSTEAIKSLQLGGGYYLKQGVLCWYCFCNQPVWVAMYFLEKEKKDLNQIWTPFQEERQHRTWVVMFKHTHKKKPDESLIPLLCLYDLHKDLFCTILHFLCLAFLQKSWIIVPVSPGQLHRLFVKEIWILHKESSNERIWMGSDICSSGGAG